MHVGAPPDMVRWIPRNGENNDCVIVALQLACGLTYETILAAAILEHPDAVNRGLQWTEIRRITSRLGYTTKLLRRGRYDLDEATGVLNVRKQDYDHVVYLWKGRVIEPADHALWADPDDYLECMGLKPGCLLTLTPKRKKK